MRKTPWTSRETALAKTLYDQAKAEGTLKSPQPVGVLAVRDSQQTFPGRDVTGQD